MHFRYDVYTEHRGVETSICPTLGQHFPEFREGSCTPDLKRPEGKTIPVSVLGAIWPFVMYGADPRFGGEISGGTDFLFVELLAKKFKFTPSFITEKHTLKVNEDGSKEGLIHKVY